MVNWKPTTPIHVRKSIYTSWKPWFAWYPVRLQESDEWYWLMKVYYRKVAYPPWFGSQAVQEYQYSLIKKGYWEK